MTSDKGKILLAITDWDPEIWLEQFRIHAPDRQVVTERADNDAAIRYALVWKQKPGALENLPNMELIFSLGAGVDHIFRDKNMPDVPLARIVSEDLTRRMTEYVVWQVLDHHRLGARYRKQQSKHIWHEDPRQAVADEVTVGIMGLGVLGRDAAEKLKVLGFNVTGWSRRPQEIEGVRCFAGKEGFAPFLAGADIIVCLLPLTPDTKGILSMSMFAQLKQGGPLGAPVLINAGRGGLQNEADLLAALDRGYLSAVTLDVFSQEPLPAGSPFWDHPKVTITPHAAASSSAKALVPQIIRQMEAYERDGTIINKVDINSQY